MENVIIWGAGINGLKLKRNLEKFTESVKVCFFCDNNTKKQGCSLEGVKILSYDQIVQMYEEGWDGSIVDRKSVV